MIEKREFYHGAAIVRIINDPHFVDIHTSNGGYVINNNVYIMFKYRTKNNSPWLFNLDSAEMSILNIAASTYLKVFVALVCGGDGICPLTLKEITHLLKGSFGTISIKRKYQEQYKVEGSGSVLKNKIALNQWPSTIFH